MAILAIETATRQLGVAVVDGQRVLASYEILADYPHAVELPNAVTQSLGAARVSLQHIEAITVDIGPGSFTGLRIGLAFAKALAFPDKKPLVAISSLEVLAANLTFAPQLVCPVLDAKQKNVYAASYRLKAGRPVRQCEPFLGPLDRFLDGLAEPAVFLGDGAALYCERIMQRCPKAQMAAAECGLPKASTLGRLGYERFLQGQRDDARTLVPLYLYPLDCSVRGPDRPTSVLPTTPQPA